MSLSGWTLPAAAAVLVGFGLFGVYSTFRYSYIDTTAKSASNSLIPVWVSGDQGPSSARQASNTPTLMQSPSSGAVKTPTDPWTSEAMEAASREPSVEELNEVDAAVEGDDLLRGAFSDHASRPEDSVPSEVESLSDESSLPEENTTAYSQNPAQPSTGTYTGVTPQQAPTLTSLPNSPTNTETSSPPPTAAPFPSDIDDTREISNELKQVLIVEDPRALSENLARVLNREPDLEVVGQTSSAVECRNFVAGEEGLDVSIVSLFLPDGQGLDLIEELRKSCPSAPVLVLTTSLDPHDHEQMMRAGADAVLSTSADPGEIVSTLRRLSPS